MFPTINFDLLYCVDSWAGLKLYFEIFSHWIMLRNVITWGLSARGVAVGQFISLFVTLYKFGTYSFQIWYILNACVKWIKIQFVRWKDERYCRMRHCFNSTRVWCDDANVKKQWLFLIMYRGTRSPSSDIDSSLHSRYSQCFSHPFVNCFIQFLSVRHMARVLFINTHHISRTAFLAVF